MVIYPLRIAVVNLNPTSQDPIVKTISLTGSTRAVATGFNPMTRKVYIETQTTTDNTVAVFIVDADTITMEEQPIPTTLIYTGRFGGVLVNPLTDKLILGGTGQVGVMDISLTPPVFNDDSIIVVDNTDSLSLNFETEIVFVAEDGVNVVIDTSAIPLKMYSFQSATGTTDGNAFDNLTNTLIVDPEFEDRTIVCKFEELTLVEENASATDLVPRFRAKALTFQSAFLSVLRRKVLQETKKVCHNKGNIFIFCSDNPSSWLATGYVPCCFFTGRIWSNAKPLAASPRPVCLRTPSQTNTPPLYHRVR